MNPCKCGWYGDPSGRCTCSQTAVDQYLGRISGPLLDRIDLIVEVPAVHFEELSRRGTAEPSKDIKRRVDAARERQHERFRSDGARCNALMLLLLAGLLASVVLAVGIGKVPIPFARAYRIIGHELFGTGESSLGSGSEHDIIWQIRLPRTILAVFVGMGLSVVGCVMQAICKNPMADPYILGVSSGATLGATASILLGVGAAFGSNATGVCACLGAFGANMPATCSLDACPIPVIAIFIFNGAYSC